MSNELQEQKNQPEKTMSSDKNVEITDNHAESDQTKYNRTSNDESESLFSFGGRIRRTKFWAVNIISSLIWLGFQLIVEASGDGNMVFVILFAIPIVLVVLAIDVKRWHDLNKSGWMVLTLFIPLVGFLIFLYLGLAAGTAGSNKYGEKPQ